MRSWKRTVGSSRSGPIAKPRAMRYDWPKRFPAAPGESADSSASSGSAYARLR